MQKENPDIWDKALEGAIKKLDADDNEIKKTGRLAVAWCWTGVASLGGGATISVIHAMEHAGSANVKEVGVSLGIFAAGVAGALVSTAKYYNLMDRLDHLEFMAKLKKTAKALRCLNERLSDSDYLQKHY